MKIIKKNPIYLYLMILTVASAFGLQGWRTLYNNFAVEIVKLDGFQIGIIQSVREIPGFLALLALLLITYISEQKLSSLSIILMGIGITLTGMLPSFTGLIITTLLMSFGFHYFETINQSLILQNFDEHQSPIVMGKQRSMMALISIIVGVGIFISSNILSYTIIFIILGCIVLITGIWGFFNVIEQKDTQKQHKKMILRKEYTLFYILTLLSGARRQIFMVFSILLLVKNFQMSIQEITILFVLNNIINYFFAPFIAKTIKKHGEKFVLNIEYSSLIIIFIFYAYCEIKWIVCILYIFDHLTFNGSMAIRTYFQKIADKKDISSSIAISFTINHIAAIILPFLGGYLWMINYKIPFLLGAFIGLLSLIATQFIKIKKRLYEK